MKILLLTSWFLVLLLLYLRFQSKWNIRRSMREAEKKRSIGQIAGYYFHVVVLWVKLQATVLGVCWAIFLSL